MLCPVVSFDRNSANLNFLCNQLENMAETFGQKVFSIAKKCLFHLVQVSKWNGACKNR